MATHHLSVSYESNQKIRRGAVFEIEKFKVINHLRNLPDGHILYFFENIEEYIKNIVDFVVYGIEQNQSSIIIENDRITPLVKESLASILNSSQLNKVRFVNNYDFYFAKGNFQCNSIFEYVPILFKDYAEQGFIVRSWAHIEWGDIQEIHNNLLESEEEAEVIVRKKRLLSVCAYDSDRVSEELKKGLLTHHTFLMEDVSSL